MRRIVFSSSEYLTRAAWAKVAGVETAFVSRVSVAAGSLFATRAPSDCRLCASPVVKISHLPFCEDCLSDVRPIDGGVCAVCAEGVFAPNALASDTGELRGVLCRRLDPAFVKAAAYGSYDDGLRDLIQLLKYEHVRPAAIVLGRMLAEVIEVLAPGFREPSPVVVPVPLHQHKLRERGFNQSELIARAALKLKHGGLEPSLQSAVLERTRSTRSQTGLTREQRRENMRGAFVVAEPAQIKSRDVLLVDDVFTTGTTVLECARLLRRAGAHRVWVATVARTLKVEATHAIAPDSEDDALRFSMSATAK